jgi:hypothetical protein
MQIMAWRRGDFLELSVRPCLKVRLHLPRLAFVTTTINLAPTGVMVSGLVFVGPKTELTYNSWSDLRTFV